MLKRAIMSFSAVMAFAAPSWAVDTRMIERGMEDLSYARSQLHRLIEENTRHHNGPLMDRLATIEDLLAQSHQSIASGLYSDRPDEPDRADYKYVCKSTSVPDAIGKGWTQTEARAGAATGCKAQKQSIYCDEESEFTCEAVPNVYPRRGLDYSKSCLSNAVPGVIGYGWTALEARATAAALCAKEKQSIYCDDDSEFTCEAVNPDFLKNNRPPYRFACLSNYVPGAIGKGLTKTEAIAEAAKTCKATRNTFYCDDDSEFTCEAAQ